MFPMPRILWSMAQDGLFYKFLSKVNQKTKMPINSTIACSIVASAIVCIFDLNVLVDFMSVGTLAAYSLCGYSVLVLRYRPCPKADTSNNRGPTLEQSKKATKWVNIMAIGSFAMFFIRFQIPHLVDFMNMNKLEKTQRDNAPSILESTDTTWITFFRTCEILAVVIAAYSCWVLRKIEESHKEVFFKVPHLPYVPTLNYVISSYLMAELSLNIWIMLILWLSTGYAVYFSYGIHNSSEARKDGSDEERVELKS